MAEQAFATEHDQPGRAVGAHRLHEGAEGSVEPRRIARVQPVDGQAEESIRGSVGQVIPCPPGGRGGEGEAVVGDGEQDGQP